MPRWLRTFQTWMLGKGLKEIAAKCKIQTLRLRFQVDRKSPTSMATPEYLQLAKEPREGISGVHSVRCSTLALWADFFQRHKDTGSVLERRTMQLCTTSEQSRSSSTGGSLQVAPSSRQKTASPRTSGSAAAVAPPARRPIQHPGRAALECRCRESWEWQQAAGQAGLIADWRHPTTRWHRSGRMQLRTGRVPLGGTQLRPVAKIGRVCAEISCVTVSRTGEVQHCQLM